MFFFSFYAYALKYTNDTRQLQFILTSVISFIELCHIEEQRQSHDGSQIFYHSPFQSFSVIRSLAVVQGVVDGDVPEM